MISLAALVPTTGDFGVTWDEPQYRHSQLLAVQWWRQLSEVRSWREAADVFDPITLLYFWDYGQLWHQLSSPAGRPYKFSRTHTFRPLDERHPVAADGIRRRICPYDRDRLSLHVAAYGEPVGLVMAGSLLLMPRLYGQAHLIDTDIPGLLLWAATALAFWKGLHEAGTAMAGCGRHLAGPGVRRKNGRGHGALAAPALVGDRASAPNLARPGGRFDWIDGALTSARCSPHWDWLSSKFRFCNGSFPLPTDQFFRTSTR